jgi:hypothetical protein
MGVEGGFSLGLVIVVFIALRIIRPCFSSVPDLFR